MATLLLTACSTGEERQHALLMEQIEKQVRLPEGAHPLGDYARYYAYGESGLIEALYVIPYDDGIQPGETCEELLANFETREVACPDSSNPVENLNAGQRRWMDDYGSLPGISDGGCSVVNVMFDPSTAKVKKVACNGNA